MPSLIRTLLGAQPAPLDQTFAEAANQDAYDAMIASIGDALRMSAVDAPPLFETGAGATNGATDVSSLWSSASDVPAGFGLSNLQDNQPQNSATGLPLTAAPGQNGPNSAQIWQSAVDPPLNGTGAQNIGPLHTTAVDDSLLDIVRPAVAPSGPIVPNVTNSPDSSGLTLSVGSYVPPSSLAGLFGGDASGTGMIVDPAIGNALGFNPN